MHFHGNNYDKYIREKQIFILFKVMYVNKHRLIFYTRIFQLIKQQLSKPMIDYPNYLLINQTVSKSLKLKYIITISDKVLNNFYLHFIISNNKLKSYNFQLDLVSQNQNAKFPVA